MKLETLEQRTLLAADLDYDSVVTLAKEMANATGISSADGIGYHAAVEEFIYNIYNESALAKALEKETQELVKTTAETLGITTEALLDQQSSILGSFMSAAQQTMEAVNPWVNTIRGIKLGISTIEAGLGWWTGEYNLEQAAMEVASDAVLFTDKLGLAISLCQLGGKTVNEIDELGLVDFDQWTPESIAGISSALAIGSLSTLSSGAKIKLNNHSLDLLSDTFSIAFTTGDAMQGEFEASSFDKFTTTALSTLGSAISIVETGTSYLKNVPIIGGAVKDVTDITSDLTKIAFHSKNIWEGNYKQSEETFVGGYLNSFSNYLFA